MPWRRVPAAASAHRLAETEPQRAETEEPSRPSRCETLAHALTRARVELRRSGPLTRSLQRSAKTQMPGREVFAPLSDIRQCAHRMLPREERDDSILVLGNIRNIQFSNYPIRRTLPAISKTAPVAVDSRSQRS